VISVIPNSTKSIRTLIFSAALVVVLMGRAHAQTWLESGTAGETLSTYQNTVGTGALNFITGTSVASWANLYGIYISNPGIFSATTVGSALSDPQLYLFTASGIGILSNDDTGGSAGLQSTLPAGNSHLTALSPGFYLIGISRYDRNPVDSASVNLFANTYPGLDFPTAGAGPLVGWSGITSEVASYTITLTGASYGSTAIPEPAAGGFCSALGCAAAALFWRRKKR
jgi:hypothetical protein